MNNDKVLEFLQTEPLATLVTMSAESRPCTATVFTYVDEDFNCYCVTKESTEKYENISRNAVVALSYYSEAKLASCEVSGNASIVHEGEDVTEAIEKLLEIMETRHGREWVPPVSQLNDTRFGIIKIVPTHLKFIDYANSPDKDAEPVRIEFDV